MPDITMCSNNECYMCDSCWRFCCPPDRDNQSYYHFEPNKDENGEEGECEFYISFSS